MKRWWIYNLLLAYAIEASAQSPYPNFDFESGTLAGWSGQTGTCCPIGMQQAGFQSSRHALVSGPGTDPYSMGLLPMVAPGGQYSLRLGNDSIHSEAERVSYTLVVDASAPLLIVRYAVVLEYPAGHPPAKQPRFEVHVRDAQGASIPCGQYEVVSASQIPGFLSVGDYRIKPWSEVALDLRPYTGQQVTVEFATGDCGMGGHFGYAYVDGYATRAAVQSSGCNPDGTITLTAPPGFQYAWSTGQTTQQVTISHYNGGQPIGVSLLSYTGCVAQLDTILPSFVPVAAFSQETGCDLEVRFTDLSAGPFPITSRHWDFGDGAQSSATDPGHVYASPGAYPVTLRVGSEGCESRITTVIPVDYTVQAAIGIEPGPLCVGEPMRFQDLSVATEGQVSAHYWEFGDLSQSTEGHPTHVYIHPGMYPVSLFVTTTQGCNSTAHKNLVVLAEDSCATPGGQVFLPNTFTPNGDGLNDRFHAVTNGAVVTGMEIYDRWGRAVFRAINGNPVWDGRLKNGRPARDGVYTYKLSARLPDGDLRQITGFVLLLH